MKHKGKILDLCCGAGRISIPLAQMGFNVVGIDNNLKMIKTAKKLKRKLNVKNVKFIYADTSQKGGLGENQYDYALLINSFEDIASKEKKKYILKNVFLSLKDGGLFIMSSQGCFLPSKIPLFLFFYNLNYFIKRITFSETSLDLNDIIFYEKNKKRFYHLYFPWEIKKIIKETGFKLFEIIPLNVLDKRKNRFKNLKIYWCIKSFLHCYWIMFK